MDRKFNPMAIYAFSPIVKNTKPVSLCTILNTWLWWKARCSCTLSVNISSQHKIRNEAVTNSKSKYKRLINNTFLYVQQRNVNFYQTFPLRFWILCVKIFINVSNCVLVTYFTQGFLTTSNITRWVHIT